jgi:long-chain acyl-CoA synthetase
MLLTSFLETADRNAKKLAVRDIRGEISYGNLAVLAGAMRRLIAGETERENVGLLLPSTTGFVASFFGGLWAGKRVVPLNLLLRPEELAAVVKDSGVDLILSCKPLRELAEQLPARVLYLEKAGLRRRYLRAKLSRLPEVPATDPDDIAVILYTSGTTGVPRGVCLTHRNLHSNTMAALEHLRLEPDRDRFLGVLPLYHSFGLTTLMMLPMLLGASVFYHARFQPAQVLHDIRADRITLIAAVPSLFGALVRTKTAPRDTFKSVRVAISGGEPLSQAVFDEYRDYFDFELLEGYGLTETSPIVSCNLPWANRAGTVGRTLPGIEVCVRGNDDGPVAPGEDGELYVRGPCVMRGYYRKPADTRAVLRGDGWLRTGDLGNVDDEGYITITGRKKDLIIVGGDNVYPREIEAVLDRHPGVAESSVIGMPDAHRGEVVVGFVVPREGLFPTPLELREHCHKHLANFKVPRKIVVDGDLPRGPTGKVLKRLLRERVSAIPAA